MIEIVVLVAFFASLVIGALVANALGRLPDAAGLQEEDRVRFARFERSF
jgi:hypothetical protein